MKFEKLWLQQTMDMAQKMAEYVSERYDGGGSIPFRYGDALKWEVK